MSKAIVYFDGVCNLCNSMVDRLCKDDQQERLLFCSLQSERARKQLNSIWHSIQHKGVFNTIVVTCQGQYYTQAAAAIMIARLVGGKYRLLLALQLLPLSWRNVLYNYVARNRYRWWGTKKACRIPTSRERNRFICS